MGQGVRTSIPMIVADELEADWQQINVVQGLADEKYGSQNTDGSRSIRRFYQPLREAGAAARIMLEQAAAQYWHVPVTECVAKKGQVEHSKSNRKKSFGSLVKIAALLPVPQGKDLRLKSKEDFNFIGKSNVALVDGKAIVTGKSIYGYDIDLPNLHYAVIARPPVFAGKVKKLDASKTRKIAGVIDVIQLDDFNEPAGYKALGGVAVIADNTWSAIKGRQALIIEWHHGEHSEYNSADYKAMLAKSCSQADNILRDKGDVKTALARASQQINADYYVPTLVHAPMEPPAATAHFYDDKNGGKFDIWACVQAPQSAQATVAEITGVAKENINVNVTLLGGAFGRKSKSDFVVEAAILAKQLKVPVKVLWTREDDIQHGYYHAVSYQKLTAGIDENNRVSAWQHYVALPPIGATFSKGSDLIGFEAGLGLIDMPYNIANVRCAAGRAKAHTRIGWLRSVTNINQAFAVCCFADELAHNVNSDSKDFLLSFLGEDRFIDLSKENAKYGNYGEKLDQFPIDISRYKRVLERVAEMSNWHDKRPQGYGLGIAVHRSFVSYIACVVEISTNEQGKIKIENFWFSVDCGTSVNPERITAQMEGAAVFGTSIAFYGEITAKSGIIEQGNFDNYPIARMGESAPTYVDIVESDEPPGGLGEPGVPPVAPAICNAIFAATGKRYRSLPLVQYGIV